MSDSATSRSPALGPEAACEIHPDQLERTPLHRGVDRSAPSCSKRISWHAHGYVCWPDSIPLARPTGGLNLSAFCRFTAPTEPVFGPIIWS